jgi:hypothetical protein
MQRIHLTAILFLTALFWASLLFVAGFQLTPELARPFSLVVTLVFGSIALFELYLWRLQLLQGWFVKRPFLQGTWAMTLESDWIDPCSGTPVAHIEAYLAVRQTYTTVSLRLMTAESSSKMLGADVVAFPDALYVLTGVYQNEPRVSLRNRSPIHYGAIILHVRGTPPVALDGSYWTDRKTRGELRSTGFQRTLYETFEAASGSFRKDATPERATRLASRQAIDGSW